MGEYSIYIERGNIELIYFYISKTMANTLELSTMSEKLVNCNTFL